MTVIPVQTVRHRPRNRVVVHVSLAGWNVEQHVVRIAVRTHVHSVRVQIQRSRRQRRRIDRHAPARRCECRIVEVLDREILQIVVVMNDQSLSGIDAESRRRIDVTRRGRSVRRRTADDLVPEEQKIRHGRRSGIERNHSLMSGQAHLENTISATQFHRLPIVDGGSARAVIAAHLGRRFTGGTRGQRHRHGHHYCCG